MAEENKVTENKVTENNTRTRIKLSQTSKGLIQFEISAEYDSPEKSVEEMEKAVLQTRQLISKLGLKAVDEVA